MALSIKRGKQYQSFLVQENGGIVSISLKEIQEKTGAVNLVRIQADEYKHIDPSNHFLTHFNLEDTDVIPGNTYLLPKIIEVGYFDHITEEEKDPIMSFEDIFITKCITVDNNIKYEDIDSDSFEFSMGHIKNISQLKEVTWNRYHKSMPRLTKEEVEKLGVAVARHEILDRKTFKFNYA